MEILLVAAVLAAFVAWGMILVNAVRAWRAGHRGFRVPMHGMHVLNTSRAP
jgi:hypothetical protein